MIKRGHHPPQLLPHPAHLLLPAPQQLLSVQAPPHLNPAKAPLQPLLPSAPPQLHPAQAPPQLLLPSVPSTCSPPVPACGAPSKLPMSEGIEHIMKTKDALRYLRNRTCYTSQVEDMDRALAGTMWLFRAPIGKEDVSDSRNVRHQ